MFEVTNKEVWCENCHAGIFLFPGVKLSKNFPFKFGENFYRDQDRWGRSILFLKFPLNTKMIKRQNVIILVNDDQYCTKLVWSRSKLNIFGKKYSMFSMQDYNNIIGHYYLLSARKGTVIRARDGEQEMELVF